MRREPQVLFVSGRLGGATLRYRVRMAEEHLRSQGIRTASVYFQSPRLKEWADAADVVTVYRAGASTRILDLLEHCARRGIPTTFDVDDRVFLGRHVDDVPFLDDFAPAARESFTTELTATGPLVPIVQSLSASTRPLVDELAEHGAPSARTAVLPNGFGRVAERLAASTRRDRPAGARVRVAYFAGSATHDADWAEAEPGLLRALSESPGAELWVVGNVTLSTAWHALGSRVVRMQPVPWDELPELIAAVDLNLAPLDDSPFTEAKSAIKWLEAAIVGTPTVATATRPFRDAVADGAGVLVPHGGDWYEPVSRLIADAALRADMGEQARAVAHRAFGPAAQARVYGEFFRAAARAGVDRDAMLAAVAAARETGPLLTFPPRRLEPYEFPDDVADLTFRPGAKGARPSRVRRLVRDALR